MSSTSGSHWCYLFHKEVKSWDSTTWFRIWQFQTPAWKRYLQKHPLAERFVFAGWWSGFSERGSQDLSNGTNVASQLANFSSVCTSVVYGYRTAICILLYLPRSLVHVSKEKLLFDQLACEILTNFHFSILFVSVRNREGYLPPSSLQGQAVNDVANDWKLDTLKESRIDAYPWVIRAGSLFARQVLKPSAHRYESCNTTCNCNRRYRPILFHFPGFKYLLVLIFACVPCVKMVLGEEWTSVHDRIQETPELFQIRTQKETYSQNCLGTKRVPSGGLSLIVGTQKWRFSCKVLRRPPADILNESLPPKPPADTMFMAAMAMVLLWKIVEYLQHFCSDHLLEHSEALNKPQKNVQMTLKHQSFVNKSKVLFVCLPEEVWPSYLGKCLKMPQR